MTSRVVRARHPRGRAHVPGGLLRAVAVLAALAAGGSSVRAQSNPWDSTISNTHWYVPAAHLLAYATPAVSLTNPIPIGDQTLWALGASIGGRFTGTSTAQLRFGPMLVVSDTTIQGTVTSDGRITMLFTPVGGGTPTIGLGQMRTVGGTTAMEMQMITGENLLVTHWASMLPYDPATFTPPPSEVVFSNASPQWSWTAGTPWRIVSPALFGSSAPGRFLVTNYQGGYFWGRGAGPDGRPFTLLGSITPEGKVLLSTLSQRELTSLYGNVSGDPRAAQMLLSEYDGSGNPTGSVAVVSLMQPFPEILAALNNRHAAGAAAALFRLAASEAGFSGPMAPVLTALFGLEGPALVTAIGQTLPVLAGAAPQATYDMQRRLQQAVAGRLDGLRGVAPGADAAAARTVWMQPLGGLLRQDGRDGVPGYRASGGGLVAGADHAVTPRLTLGALVAYAHNAVSGSDAAISNALGIDSFLAGIYGACALLPGLDLDLQLDAGVNPTSERRGIGFIGRTASARYASYSMHAGLGLQASLPAGADLVLRPVLRLDYGRVRSDGYSETGADGLNLNVGAGSYRELMLTAGLKGAYRLAARTYIIADAGVGYNALDEQPQITASFAGGGGSFVTHGLDRSPWLFSAGAGLRAAHKDGLDVSMRYGVHASPTGYLDQAGSVLLKVRL